VCPGSSQCAGLGQGTTGKNHATGHLGPGLRQATGCAGRIKGDDGTVQGADRAAHDQVGYDAVLGQGPKHSDLACSEAPAAAEDEADRASQGLGNYPPLPASRVFWRRYGPPGPRQAQAP
jgi:hypothetical protein